MHTFPQPPCWPPFIDGKLIGQCEARCAIVEWHKAMVRTNVAANLTPWGDLESPFVTWLNTLQTSWAPPAEATVAEDTPIGEAAAIEALTDGNPDGA